MSATSILPPMWAKIVSLETSDEFSFPYNPKEFSLKRNSGLSGKTGDGPWGGLKLDCPTPDELSMEFVLDVSEPITALQMVGLLMPISSLLATAGNLDVRSVLTDLGKLYKLTVPHLVDAEVNVKRQPFVAFLWGDFQFFGAIQNIDSKMVLFDLGGIPKRAEVSMTMLGQAMYAPGKSAEIAGQYDAPGFKWPKLKTFSGPVTKKSSDPRMLLLGMTALKL